MTNETSELMRDAYRWYFVKFYVDSLYLLTPPKSAACYYRHPDGSTKCAIGESMQEAVNKAMDEVERYETAQPAKERERGWQMVEEALAHFESYPTGSDQQGIFLLRRALKAAKSDQCGTATDERQGLLPGRGDAHGACPAPINAGGAISKSGAREGSDQPGETSGAAGTCTNDGAFRKEQKAGPAHPPPSPDASHSSVAEHPRNKREDASSILAGRPQNPSPSGHDTTEPSAASSGARDLGVSSEGSGPDGLGPTERLRQCEAELRRRGIRDVKF